MSFLIVSLFILSTLPYSGG